METKKSVDDIQESADKQPAKKIPNALKSINFNVWGSVVCFVASIPIVYLISIRNFDSIKRDWISWVIIGIMCAILIADAILARKKLISITGELNDYTKYLISTKKHNIVFSPDFFKNEFLKRCAENFETERTSHPDADIDIAYYINEQTIAAVIHRDITDQLANAFTGLGILGTFIGLTKGLQTFNSQDAINSTPQLLSGIKIAFHTSIFGVIASLIYNHFYHRDIEANNIAIIEFCDAFYKKIMPNPEAKYYDVMITNAEEQTKALKSLSGTLAGELEPVFAKAIADSVKPTMEKLNKSIDDYIMNAVDAQSETLNKIVDKFLNHLNKSLNNQFDNLSRSIKDMCTWQDEATVKLKTIMGSVDSTAVSMSKLSIDLSNAERIQKESADSSLRIVNEMDKYQTNYHIFIEEVRHLIEVVKNDVDKTVEHTTSLDKSLEKRYEESKILADKIVEMSKIFEAYKNSVETAIKSQQDDNASLHEAITSITDSMDTASESITGSNRENLKVIQSVFTQLIESVEVQKQQSQKMMDDIKRITDEISKQVSNSQEFTDAAQKTLEEIAAWKRKQIFEF